MEELTKTGHRGLLDEMQNFCAGLKVQQAWCSQSAIVQCHHLQLEPLMHFHQLTSPTVRGAQPKLDYYSNWHCQSERGRFNTRNNGGLAFPLNMESRLWTN